MEDTAIAELIAWGQQQPDVRAMVITSTRAVEGATIDRFSDYDVILFLTDVATRYEDRTWLNDFGETVIDWWDPIETDTKTGMIRTGNIVYYTGTKKFDFTLWPVAMAAQIASQLPQELDAGYRILIDKDDLTAAWPVASGVGYARSLPNCEQFLALVNDFFIGVPYVATALLRGEVLQAKWVLDVDMRYEYLLPMLEWYAVSIHDISIRIGVNGKQLQQYLPPGTWQQLAQTYAGMTEADNRSALDEMVSLFKTVAERVAATIGCAYPADLHERVMTHIASLEASECD